MGIFRAERERQSRLNTCEMLRQEMMRAGARLVRAQELEITLSQGQDFAERDVPGWWQARQAVEKSAAAYLAAVREYRRAVEMEDPAKRILSRRASR